MDDPAVKVSSDGRHFEDHAGVPLFWLGDTQWNLFRCHTAEEAETILENRKRKGFTVIQAMLLGFRNQVNAEAVFGEAFVGDDPARPNPAYFRHVDEVVEIARRKGITLAIGIDHPAMRLTNADTARACGQWLGERYGRYANIIWIASYCRLDGAGLQITREIARGLREGEGFGHLVSCHPDPADPVASSGVSHGEDWLDFHCIQTFRSIGLIYSSVMLDCSRVPRKPVVLAEGAYEDGPEYGFPITPYLIRRQAYLSCFAGGYCSYGHNDNWRVTASWRASLDSPGAAQMKVLKDVFSSIDWWSLRPDNSILAGAGPSGDGVCMAMQAAGSGIRILYCGGNGLYPLCAAQCGSGSPDRACWIDPRSGERVPAVGTQAGKYRTYAYPEGWEDALLVLPPIGEGN